VDALGGLTSLDRQSQRRLRHRSLRRSRHRAELFARHDSEHHGGHPPWQAGRRAAAGLRPLRQQRRPHQLLGFPTGDELLLPNGNHRQTFEGGSIEYGPTSAAVLKLPVNNVSLQARRFHSHESWRYASGAGRAFAANGNPLDGRVFSFITSNSRVVTVQANGAAAVLRAVRWTAKISVVSEGKSSAIITILSARLAARWAKALRRMRFNSCFRMSLAAIAWPYGSRCRSGSPRGAGYVQELQHSIRIHRRTIWSRFPTGRARSHCHGRHPG